MGILLRRSADRVSAVRRGGTRYRRIPRGLRGGVEAAEDRGKDEPRRRALSGRDKRKYQGGL